VLKDSSISEALVARQSSMAGNEEKVAQLREVTGLGAEAARQMLGATDGNLEEAVMLHFGAEDGPVGDAPTGSSGSRSGAAASGGGYAAGETVQPARLPTGAETPSPTPLDNDSSSTLAVENPVVPQQEATGWFSSIGNAMSSISQAVLGIAPEEFENWFVCRYGTPSPAWSKECFGDAARRSLAEGKLLLIWFHQAENAATESLCRQVLQNDMVLELAQENYVCWAGDVNRFEPGQIARLLGATVFPTVVVLQPLRHGFDNTFCLEWPLGTFAQPLFRLSPTIPGEALNVDQAITAVVTAAQDHRDAVQTREDDRTRRSTELAEDRQIREEQDAELQESMLIDQLKAQSLDELAAAEAQGDTCEDAAPSSSADATGETAAAAAAETAAAAAAAAKAEDDEVRRLARGDEIRALPEPVPAGSATAKISLKLPAGDRLQRVFKAEQQMADVYDWAHCCRPSAVPLNFELRTNFPAKALSDRTQTVGDSGLAPSAAIMMKAVDD